MKWLLYGLFGLFLIISIYLFRETAFRMFLPYNAEGRNLDEKSMVVFKEQAKTVYVILTIVSLVITFVLARLLKRLKNS